MPADNKRFGEIGG